MNGTLLLVRTWTTLAPKLVAFLATGLTVSGLLWALQLFGLHITPELATLIVGGLASVAAYIQRDNLLELAPGQFSLKVLAFVVTTVSATTIVAFAREVGIDLAAHAPLIGSLLTVAAALIGYFKSDYPGSANPPPTDERPLSL